MAWPAFKTAKDNPHEKLVYESLMALGAEVQEYNAKRLARQATAPDIWHVHYPESLLGYRNPLKVLRRLLRLRWRIHVARRRGVKLVWTVHNLSHTGPRHVFLTWLFRRIWHRQVDGCIHLSEAGRQVANQRYRALAAIPAYVVPHMHYRGRYADTVDKSEARKRLGVLQDARLAVFVGQLRPYKNVPHLIRIFSGLDDPKARLLVAGRKREADLAQEIEHLAAQDNRILTRLEFVPDEEMQLYFRAADLAVAPFQDMLNSGMVLLSLSFDCPILVPDRGALSEFPPRVGAQWVRLYRGELTSAILANELETATTEQRPDVNLEHYEPRAVARKMLAAYQALCAGADR